MQHAALLLATTITVVAAAASPAYASHADLMGEPTTVVLYLNSPRL